MEKRRLKVMFQKFKSYECKFSLYFGEIELLYSNRLNLTNVSLVLEITLRLSIFKMFKSYECKFSRKYGKKNNLAVLSFKSYECKFSLFKIKNP